ncbi:MAG: PhoH family protein [bacterium]
MSKAVLFQLLPAEDERLAQVCGVLDAHLQQIEARLDVKITQRRNAFSVIGNRRRASTAEAVIRGLFAITEHRAEPLTGNDVHLELARAGADGDAHDDDAHDDAREEIALKLRKQLIRGQNPRQREYLRRIRENDINFAIGPAGTGKTYLAVACAIDALAQERVERVLLVRPAVEAGEKLGFLPGNIGDKIDPYLRPLFDALYEMLGFDRVGKLIARGTIEMAPLAYMRGRTLNQSFVILDEAQNTTAEQMKMFLTRIGFGSTAIITGDITQVDLPREQRSGLKHAQRVLGGIAGISFTRFLPQDVVRHPLVQQIVEAYEHSGE